MRVIDICGITGYVGNCLAAPIILESLKTLEYRGYDSAGISTWNNGMHTIKDKGEIRKIAWDFNELRGNIGIGHTRWATHGEPSRKNAHPHPDCENSVTVVHNGIIENYLELKKMLQKKGHAFKSETDTEVISHLYEELRKKEDRDNAFLKTINMLKGSWAVILMDDELMYAAKKESPLLAARPGDGFIVSSDITGLVKYSKKIAALEEGHIIRFTREHYEVLEGHELKFRKLSVESGAVEKQGYPHFMLKEIHEQPEALKRTYSGLVSEKETVDRIRKAVYEADMTILTAAGTSGFACQYGENLLRKKGKIAQTVTASELARYKGVLSDKTVVFAVSQSGETADILVPLKEFKKEKDFILIALTNTVGSSLARLADIVLYTRAEPEIGVAATKTYTSQILSFAYLFGKVSKEDVEKLSDISKNILEMESEIMNIAAYMTGRNSALFLGKGRNYITAQEGALKFKEISYVHAEAYPSGEMKHGPIALIDKGFPVVFVIPEDENFNKTMGNIREVQSRGARIIAVTNGDKVKEYLKEDDFVLKVPPSRELNPITLIMPLQLMAYHAAVKKGYNPDKPRNLAKSVTVE